MKSVAGMFIVFIGLYIIVYSDVFSFFAQSSVTIFAISSAIAMLILALFVLGLPRIRKRGDSNDK